MGEITFRPVNRATENLPEIRELYLSSFPANERREFYELVKDASCGCENPEFLAICDGNLFVGFFVLLTVGDLSYIVYFAVRPELRGRGFGSRALREIRRLRPEKRLLVDVEDPDVPAPNREQRLRRVEFYRRSGYAETPVRYRWREEDYLILCSGGTVDVPEFDRFWDDLEQTMRWGSAEMY